MVELRPQTGSPDSRLPSIWRHMSLPFLVTQALLTVPLAVYKSVVEKADVGPEILPTGARSSGLWLRRQLAGPVICHFATWPGSERAPLRLL